MIQLRNLERSYKTGHTQTWVLRRIDLTVRAGEFLTVMGPSGAGKSSLLNALAMLDDGWAGEFFFEDAPVHNMNRKQRAELARKRIGMVFQSYHLLDDLTVAENIDLPLSYKDISRGERQAMVADTLDRFNIVGKKDLYPSQLSGGQQQLVGIARAVIHRPSLLLADEPTGNLHSAQAAEIMQLFRETERERNNHRAGDAFGDERGIRQPDDRAARWMAVARYGPNARWCGGSTGRTTNRTGRAAIKAAATAATATAGAAWRRRHPNDSANEDRHPRCRLPGSCAADGSTECPRTERSGGYTGGHSQAAGAICHSGSAGICRGGRSGRCGSTFRTRAIHSTRTGRRRCRRRTLPTRRALMHWCRMGC